MSNSIIDKPNYVLNFNEAVLMPVRESKTRTYVRIAVWAVVVILLLGSFVFRDNLFFELNWTARILLVILAIGVGFRKTDWFPSYMELRFFDDYIVFFQPKRWYSKKEIRKQTGVMHYRNIILCKYLIDSKRIQIYGKGTSSWRNLNPNGSLKDKPLTVRNFDKGMFYFNTRLAENIDFVHEIETHSPLRVVLEDA